MHEIQASVLDNVVSLDAFGVDANSRIQSVFH